VKQPTPIVPWRIAASYAAISLGWFSLVFLVLGGLDLATTTRIRLELALAAAFIGVTAVLLFLWLRQGVGLLRTAHDELRAEEERWRVALHAVGEAVWELESGTEAGVISPQCKALLGYGAEDRLETRQAWLELIHPDDREKVRAVVLAAEQAAAPGAARPDGIEFRVRAKDGSYRWVEGRGQRQLLGGRPRLIGTLTDITGRKQAEQELAAAAERYRLLFETFPSPLWVYDRRTLQLLTVNEQAVRHYGYPREEFLAMTVRDLRIASDTPSFLGSEAAEEPKVRHSGPWRHRRANGDFIWVETTSHAVEWSGRPARVVLARDVTLQRAAMHELKLLHAALQAAAAAWVITDAEGRIEWVNPAFTRLTGFTFDEVVGRVSGALEPGRHPPEVRDRIWAAIRRGEVWEGDLLNRRKDGAAYHEHSVIAPVRDAHGVLQHVVEMKHDTTAERHLEQHLARSQRLESIGMLASGIAHDLNNVLTPILLSVEFLREDYPDAGARARLELIAQAAQRGAGIVRQVLAFARGEGGERRPLDPGLLLKEIGQFARETLPRNIRIEMEVPREGAMVDGDVTQIHQALLNLVLNARDAMPSGGRLRLQRRDVELDEEAARLRSLEPGRHVELVVADTGTGIAPENLDRIFDPFFTTKDRGKGTGLGLSAVYGIARAHGGSIEVESRPGEGSRFTLVLPVLAPFRLETDELPEVRPVDGRGKRVLVVDDEHSIRELVTALLRRCGFEVEVAEDGWSGLEAFRRRPAEEWSVALVDMLMPRLGGAEVVQALRQAAPGLPIIIISGFIPEDAEAKAALAAVAVTLPKPFSAGQLFAALDEALGPPPPP
jgi:PAS domain S-box-containing protein